MASSARIGVLLPAHAALPGAVLGDIGTAARQAEELGLDSVWVGDHLTTGHPLVESTIALACAATTTRRIGLGVAVMIPALRQPAWAAKQLASLQYVSRNRLLLGVGVGVATAGEWDAAGVPPAGRGRRTDDFLGALPGLLSGQPTTVGGVTVTLEPAVAVPEIWIGGTSDAALARAVKFGHGWLSALLTPDQLTQRAAKLDTALAIGTMVFAHLTETTVDDPAAPVVRFLTGSYGLELAQAKAISVGGTPEQVAEQLAEYTAAGVSELVIVPFGQDYLVQYELLARARSLL